MLKCYKIHSEEKSMPQTKSAKKRMRQNEKRAERNRQIKNRTKNSIKGFVRLIDQKNLKKQKKDYLN